MDLLHLGPDLRHFGADGVRNDLEVLAAEVLQRLVMGRKAAALGQLQVKNQDIQLSLGGDLRIQLPQRTGGGVAGVGKGRQPLLFPAAR